mgnify:CR=1 FL=1
MRKLNLIILFIAIFILSCSQSKSSDKEELIIYCSHPLDLMNTILDDFKLKNPEISVEVVTAGTGELLKRVEAEKDNPLGDILWGGTITTVKRQIDLFENYTSTNEVSIVDIYKNVEGPFTRCDAMPSILMVNTNLSKNIKIEGYGDLLNPALKGKIAAADPAASSSAFEHLVNMLYAMGDGNPEKGWDYVKKLCANLDGKLLSGSSAVYKGVADGEYTVGLTFEQGGAMMVAQGSPIKLIYMKEGVISKPEGVYIIKGAKNLENAKKFIDYCVSLDAQNILINKVNRRAIRKDASSSEVVIPMTEIYSIKDDPDFVESNRQKWLDKFRDIYTGI